MPGSRFVRQADLRLADRGAPRSESRINMIAGGNHTLIYALAAPLLHLPPAAQRLAALQGELF